MWSSLSSEEINVMREEIRLLHIACDDGGSLVWVAWAEIYLNTLELPEPNMHATRAIFPLAVWLSKTMDVPIEAVQSALKESLPRILFQAKLAGRELNTDDGVTAIRVIRSSLKEADG